MTTPAWALRLIGAVLVHEDVHAKDDVCFREAISLVPEGAIAAARVLLDCAPLDEVAGLRLTALRQLAERLPDGGHLITELLDMTPDDLREHLR